MKLVPLLVFQLVATYQMCTACIYASCPSKYLNFWLYNEQTWSSPVLLTPEKYEKLTQGGDIAILLHDYMGTKDTSPNNWLRQILVYSKEVNVVSLDYAELVKEGCYGLAVYNVHTISSCLAKLIDKLLEVDWMTPDKLHVIGHGLGAHVAGQLSNYVNQKLKHITGLDPLSAEFHKLHKRAKLDKDDAEFVDVIHTDPFERGMLLPVGHADFYPNPAMAYQTGCESPITRSLCNHERASQLYAQSVLSSIGFWGKNVKI